MADVHVGPKWRMRARVWQRLKKAIPDDGRENKIGQAYPRRASNGARLFFSAYQDFQAATS